MKRALVTGTLTLLSLAGCQRETPQQTAGAKAFGVAIVDVSGEKQAAGVGATLDQPVVVKVTDAQGNGLAGALVQFSASGGLTFDPSSGPTGSDGQFSSAVRLGGMSGQFQVIARTRDRQGKLLPVTFDEIALDYQQTLGQQLNEKYCSRCHNAESTSERVSNHDNLSVPPHPFTDGATLNQISDANLIAIISHGGTALGKSAEMPPYTPTLSKTDIGALVAYIRAVADPPYRPQGVFYARQ